MCTLQRDVLFLSSLGVENQQHLQSSVVKAASFAARASPSLPSSKELPHQHHLLID
jgi:hypothetical protein